jgi:two-component system, chemotaxis family, response regulator WspF
MKLQICHTRPAALTALKAFFAQQSSYQISHTSGDLGACLRTLALSPPDILLLELKLLKDPSLDLDRLNTGYGLRVLALSDDPSADVDAIYQALHLGVFDAVETPRLNERQQLTGSRALLQRLQRIERLGPVGNKANAQHDHAGQLPPLLALGASTGGPKAILRVLQDLPRPLLASVLVVQHFVGESLADLPPWLARESGLKVSLARHGEMPLPGCVYIADVNRHLGLSNGGRMVLSAPAPDELHCPSVNHLFSTLAANAVAGSAALLSGMGEDGAMGLLELKHAGWWTIGQDEKSCAVYGMPRAAAALGAVAEERPLGEIGARLVRMLPASTTR